MTTTKRTQSHRAQLTITTRHGKIRPRVRYRAIDVEDGLALVLMAIILAARLFDVMIGFVLPIITSLAARFARGSVHYTVRTYRALRAFYIP